MTIDFGSKKIDLGSTYEYSTVATKFDALLGQQYAVGVVAVLKFLFLCTRQ